MHMPLLVKLRIAAIAVMAALIFTAVGWHHISTGPNGQAVTIVEHTHSFQTFMIALGLTVFIILPAMFIAKPYIGHLAPLAVPFALTAWAARSPNMTSLLIQYHTADARIAFFRSLIVDTIGWFVLILAGYAVVAFTCRLLSKKEKAASADAPRIKSPPPPPGQTQISSGPSGSTAGWLRNLIPLAITVVLAVIILKITARSGYVPLDHLPQVPLVFTVPTTGQCIFAVAAAFFIASLVSHRLFPVRLGFLLFAPPITAIVAYLTAAFNPTLKLLEDQAPVFVPAAVTWSTILPIQFIAVGSLAVIAGFWFALTLHAPKYDDQG